MSRREQENREGIDLEFNFISFKDPEGVGSYIDKVIDIWGIDNGVRIYENKHGEEFLYNGNELSIYDLGIREVDGMGSGLLRSKRKDRLHYGVDFVIEPYTLFLSPVDGNVIGISDNVMKKPEM